MLKMKKVVAYEAALEDLSIAAGFGDSESGKMGDDLYLVVSRAVVLREGEIDIFLSEWPTSSLSSRRSLRRASLGLDVAHDH